WNDLSFYDASNGIVVGDNGVVFTTTNGGANWLWHHVPDGKTCLSAIHVSPARIYVGADSGWLYQTADTGRTWGAAKISTWPIKTLFRWRGPITSFDRRFALTPFSILTENPMPVAAWLEQMLAGFQGLGSESSDAEYCLDGDAGFIVGVQGDLRAAPTILRKRSSDTGWTQIPSGTSRDGAFLGVSAPCATTVYVCGTGGMLMKSIDTGDSWSAAVIPTKQTLNAIYFFNERRGFAVGDSGTIFFTANGGVTGVSHPDNTIPEDFALCQNYPNPFNPSTTISFRLSTSAFVSLKIFDRLGREIATLLERDFPQGVHQTGWKAGAFASGTYFCRFNAGSFSEVKRLVLLK
ncbi:MAG: T9SS type A sorting domain-containing protein, partial [Ignavibacteriales bacterium]|nr:T9SS type A sorting domain-containing protein [Ignavibacteriales bacterium]